MSRPKGSKNKKSQPRVLKEFLIKASLKVLGRIYESEGNTIDEVLNNFKTDNWVKGAGVLSVTKDGITKEKIISGNHIRNIFGMASGTMKEVSLKWVRSLFE